MEKTEIAGNDNNIICDSPHGAGKTHVQDKFSQNRIGKRYESGRAELVGRDNYCSLAQGNDGRL